MKHLHSSGTHHKMLASVVVQHMSSMMMPTIIIIIIMLVLISSSVASSHAGPSAFGHQPSDPSTTDSVGHKRQSWLAGGEQHNHGHNRLHELVVAPHTREPNTLDIRYGSSLAMNNVTASVGRNATFECVFRDLKKAFLLAWLKFNKDSRLLLATNDKVVASNGRISVRSHANTTFYLTIHDIRDEDRGYYMCQVNTIPMRSHTAYLEVNVPPSFGEKETSSDLDIREGSNVRLHCKAYGRPEPDISWRREDEKVIVTGPDNTTSVVSFRGETLNLLNVSRHQIGPYLCIASNGVPPTISKRIFLGVSFAPIMSTNKAMVGIALEASVTLDCNLESYPRANVYWLKDGQAPPIIHSSKKHEIHVKDTKSPYRFNVRLKIVKVQKQDYGNYTCVAKNLHGEERATVRLYEVEKIIKPQRTNYVSRPRDIFPPTKIVPRIHTGNAQFDGNNKQAPEHKTETNKKMEEESQEEDENNPMEYETNYISPALNERTPRANYNGGVRPEVGLTSITTLLILGTTVGLALA